MLPQQDISSTAPTATDTFPSFIESSTWNPLIIICHIPHQQEQNNPHTEDLDQSQFIWNRESYQKVTSLAHVQLMRHIRQKFNEDLEAQYTQLSTSPMMMMVIIIRMTHPMITMMAMLIASLGMTSRRHYYYRALNQQNPYKPLLLLISTSDGDDTTALGFGISRAVW